MLLDYPNHNEFRMAAANLYEETPFLKYVILKHYDIYDLSFYNREDNSWFEFLTEKLENSAPIHKRWVLGQYLKDGKGLTLERQKGLIDKIAEEAKGFYAIEQMNYMASETARRAKLKK